MTFSISVPVRGQAEFLRTALESIRAQDVACEIAVLDATPDDTVQNVLVPYSDEIAYRYHRPDDGQAAAIHEGWVHTRGEILAWLNADDYYYPGALSQVREVFLEHPDIDVVYGHAAYTTTDGDFKMYFPAIRATPELLPHGCTICQPSCFVRRSAVERVGGLNRSLVYTMDWELWIRLHAAGCKFHFVDQLLSVVRDHPASKTRSGGDERRQELRKVLDRHNPQRLSRWSSMMGDRYYGLMTGRSGVGDELLYRLLRWLNRGSPHRARRPNGHPVVHGIECWTNLVSGGCELILPWYDAAPPSELVLLTDRDVSLTARLGSVEIPLEADGRTTTTYLGERMTASAHRGLLPEYTDKTLRLSVAGDGEIWRLLSASIRTTYAGTSARMLGAD